MKPFCQYCRNDPVTHLQQKELCGVCEMETKAAKRKITRADQIRAMTDEELARFMSKVETNGRVFWLKGIASWLKWLKQEADG